MIRLHGTPAPAAITALATLVVASAVCLTTLLLASAVCPAAPCDAGRCDPGTICTVAGDGPGAAGDQFYPCGVAVADDGNIYVADWYHHRIRRVGPAGDITTIAGNGQPGYSGDGGPAVEASLHFPHGVAVDAGGNVYIADSYNHRVRKVDPDGVITTVAGDGWHDEQGAGRCRGDGGPATEASLYRQHGVAVGPDGSIYIADTYNHRIRKVDAAGIITTVAGDGWHDEQGNGRCQGDGGPATEASLYRPTGVAVGGDGSIYIADRYNHRVRKVDPAGIITTVAGSGVRGYSGDGGPATEATLSWPHGVAVAPDGVVYVTDTPNHRVRKIDAAGIITTVAGNGMAGASGDGGPAAAARLNWPFDVAVAADGSLYIADHTNYLIRKVCPPQAKQG